MWGVYELVGIRLTGNRESSLGSIQDVKFAMANNMLSSVYCVANPVGELELV